MDSWTTPLSTTSQRSKITKPFYLWKRRTKAVAKGEFIDIEQSPEEEDITAFLHLRSTRYWIVPYSTTFSRLSPRRAASLSVGLPEEKSMTTSKKRPKGMKTLPSRTMELTQNTFSGNMVFRPSHRADLRRRSIVYRYSHQQLKNNS
ncbi:4382_t:CDS:1 [Paraglomus occultum]|uniref:4382_t:CDS:1 n=1 Tax=Paraglomus occultum TaxID=144539 RepID=A0A9N8YVV1_9GLOM|nr:4382_t:CDS:1 [Paraglomus occultum]